MQAVRQVVFTDVLIVGQFDVHGQSFAPIGGHKIDPSSDWLLIKQHSKGMKGLPGVLLLLNYLLALGRAYIRVLGVFTFKRFLQQIMENQYSTRREMILKKETFG